MSTPPRTIYMQWRDDELGATWTEAPVFDEDVEYVRVDMAQLDAANARIAELEAALSLESDVVAAQRARLMELQRRIAQLEREC